MATLKSSHALFHTNPVDPNYKAPEPHGLYREVGKYRPATTEKAPLFPILTEVMLEQRKEKFSKI